MGIYLLFIKRKANIETILLPLVILGAFGYHVLFEAKSQYSATYIPLLLPTAAFMMSQILFADYSKIKQLVKKINRRNGETEAEEAEAAIEADNEDDFKTYLNEVVHENEDTTFGISEAADDSFVELPDDTTEIE